MTLPPPKSECPECGHRAHWVKDHYHCSWCGHDWFPPENEDEL